MPRNPLSSVPASSSHIVPFEPPSATDDKERNQAHIQAKQASSRFTRDSLTYQGLLPNAQHDNDALHNEEDLGLAALVAREVEVNARAWESAMGQRSMDAARSRNSHTIYGIPVTSAFHPASTFWMGFMMLVDVTYTAFWVPLGVAFCTDGFGNLDHGCTVADLVGGVVYALNLLLGFQLGCIVRHDYKKYEERDGRRLARMYMRFGPFWLDLLATIPFVYLVAVAATPSLTQQDSSHSWIGILSLIRLIRLLRLVSLSKMVATNMMSGRYQDLLSRYFSVAALYTFMLAYFLAVVLNLQACILVLVAHLQGVENSWLTSLTWDDFTAVAPAYQWYCALYWVITTSTTTGYGDFTPRSPAEQVICNVYMISGMVMFGLLVGTVANTLTRASTSAAQIYQFRKKMGQVSRWLLAHAVPAATRKHVQGYFEEILEQRSEESLDNEIFRDLPAYLRCKVALYITIDTVISVHVLRDQDSGLQELVAQHLLPVHVIPGHDICRQGQVADRLWVCSEGELVALQHQAEPRNLQVPCLFGESMMLAGEMRACELRLWTVRSHSRVKLWELRLEDLLPILRMYPRLKEDLLLHIRNQLLAELGQAPSGTQPDSNWCESVASIHQTLLKQPTAVVEVAAHELQHASIEDGSLQALINKLLDFSTSRAVRLTLPPPALPPSFSKPPQPPQPPQPPHKPPQPQDPWSPAAGRSHAAAAHASHHTGYPEWCAAGSPTGAAAAAAGAVGAAAAAAGSAGSADQGRLLTTSPSLPPATTLPALPPAPGSSPPDHAGQQQTLSLHAPPQPSSFPPQPLPPITGQELALVPSPSPPPPGVPSSSRAEASHPTHGPSLLLHPCPACGRSMCGACGQVVTHSHQAAMAALLAAGVLPGGRSYITGGGGGLRTLTVHSQTLPTGGGSGPRGSGDRWPAGGVGGGDGGGGGPWGHAQRLGGSRLGLQARGGAMASGGSTTEGGSAASQQAGGSTGVGGGAGNSVLMAAVDAAMGSPHLALASTRRRWGHQDNNLGISTISTMPVHRSLGVQSIPTANFGEGYGIWG